VSYIGKLSTSIYGTKSNLLQSEATVRLFNPRGVNLEGLEPATADFRQPGFEIDISKVILDKRVMYDLAISCQS